VLQGLGFVGSVSWLSILGSWGLRFECVWFFLELGLSGFLVAFWFYRYEVDCCDC
jgi:hypothetical protein